MKKVNTLNRTALEAATNCLKSVYPELSQEELTRKLLRLDEKEKAQLHEPAPEAYTLREASQLSRLSRRTLCRRIKDGSLKAVKVGPRAVRIPRLALTAILGG
jgi:excisionase family DNA binding protein